VGGADHAACGVSCQFNFEVDLVVAMDIERNMHYCDLESSVKESRARCVFCGLYLFGLGPMK